MRFDSAVPAPLKDAYHARAEPEAARLLGFAYWAFLVCLFGVMLAGSIGYGLWEFLQPLTAPEAESVSVSAGSRKTFTKSGLQKVLQGLDERSQEFERRVIEAPPVRDPS